MAHLLFLILAIVVSSLFKKNFQSVLLKVFQFC